MLTMEILMKVKCASSPNPNTIKVVDHHHQLQQQHKPAIGSHSNVHQHFHGKHATFPAPAPPTERTTLTAPCLDCTQQTNVAMDCCALAAQKPGATCQVSNAPMDCPPYCGYASCCTGGIDYACCGGGGGVVGGYGTALMQTTTTHANSNAAYPTDASYFQHANSYCDVQMPYEYQEPEENFISIDDEKIKAFLQKIGEEQKLKAAAVTTTPSANTAAVTKVVQPQQQQQQQQQKQQKPAETFEIIELDVAKDVEKLQRIRESAEKRAKEHLLNENTPTRGSAVATTQLFPNTSTKDEKQRRKSPSISLVPTTVEHYESENIKKTAKTTSSNENIIARIDLVDSDSEISEYADGDNGFAGFESAKSVGDFSISVDDEENDEDDETASSKSLNPLLAAAAVSCELGCDDNDGEQSNNKGYVAVSDDDAQLQFIDEREEGPELRWDDFEEHSGSNSRERQLFECHICSKTVQSNYNLRRHMMIHTGERPFGCDLCDRRFREISDLKKHRRRHANQANFFCMICRINPPLETDSTRCGTCDTKNGTLIAAVRPDTVKPPPEYEHFYSLASRSPEKRKSLINQISVSEMLSDNEKDLVGKKFEISEPTTSSSSAVGEALENLVTLPTSAINDESTTSATKPPMQVNISKSTSSAAAMRALARKRELFKCPLCERVFGTRHNLKRHFMIHTGEKPFSCPHCRKPFRELSTLKKHLVTHRRDRWYKCLHCPQKYRDYLDYMEHRHVHKEDGTLGVSDFDSDGGDEEKFMKNKFNKDDTAFNPNDSNEDDDTMDYDEDSLECCECGQRFKDIDQFTEHVKEHELNRVFYECYICQHLFDAQKDLVDHMNEQHQTET